MSPPQLKLGPSLLPSQLAEIRRHLHLNCNKWDTQVGDASTLFPQPLILPAEEWVSLCHSAELLAAETTRGESLLIQTGRENRALGMPSSIWQILFSNHRVLGRSASSTRAMRFDFHPTAAGWRVSEVNSDVPGGWAEATILPDLYRPFYNDWQLPPSPLHMWSESMRRFAGAGRVAVLSAPGFLEDQQVAFAFMRQLNSHNISCSLIQNPGALKWTQEGCTLRYSRQSISAVVRFFQVEWLWRLSRASNWKELLRAQPVPVTNPTDCALSESKRFPLIFSNRSAFPAWQTLFPESRDPRDVLSSEWDEWVLKAAYSNTGDAVYICGNHSRIQQRHLIEGALKQPLKWVAQRRFETLALESDAGSVYPCIGVYVVDGKAAGAYVRLSCGQITNSSAKEAPLFIEPATLSK